MKGMRMPEYSGSSVDDVMGPAPDFDVRAYARSAVGTLRDGLDLSAYEEKPLSAQTLRNLKFLQSVERATMQHLRNVLVTPTHKDARITAFLTTWAFEKYWVADALAAVVDSHAPLPNSRRSSSFTRAFRELGVRLSPIKESMVANSIGVEMLAVHMAIGSIDGWLTQAAYARIAELEPHKELRSTLDTILSIKARHLSFFEPQAEYRLAASKRAQSITRSRLRKSAWPIGADDLPKVDRQFFFGTLLRTSRGLAESIDAAIDGLPGLHGLGLIARAAGTGKTA
jgi:hypothetical protein